MGIARKAHTLTDAVLAGLLLSKGHKILPRLENNVVVFDVQGDVEKSLREVYENEPIGSLDVLRGVKTTRSMIFDLKAGRK